MNNLLSMRSRAGSQLTSRFGLKRNALTTWSVLAALVITGFIFSPAAVAEEDGIALASIYDTSGSMRETVRDASGRPAPKYQIANRALHDVAEQIKSFASSNSVTGPRTIHTGLFIFQGERAREIVTFGPFDARAIENFASSFTNPNGNTPLGNSLNTAAKVVLDSKLPRKHILVITDGINTAGPAPEAVFPRIRLQATQKQTTVSLHLLAFDVDAKRFDPLKKLGATVVGAADEKQLNSQLEFILQKKILLEDEEPPQKSK